MTKRIACFTAALWLVLLASVLPVSAENTEPEPWRVAYFEALKAAGYHPAHPRIHIPPYAFVDFNQDGMVELILNPDRPNGFDDEVSKKIYTYADGELHLLGGGNVPLPDGYHNKQTGEIQWFFDFDPDLNNKKEMVFDFKTYQIAIKNLPYQLRWDFSNSKLEWLIDGKKVSKKQYEKAVKEWGKTYELVIPSDAYFDRTKPTPGAPYSNYETYDDVWQEMLEVISKAPTVDSKQAAQRPLLWGAVMFGGLTIVAAAIAVPVSLSKKAKKRRA